MTRKLLLLTLCAATLGAAAAPAASADQIIAADIIVKHNVVWDYQETGYPDACKTWNRGSGTQTLTIHSLKRERLRLERAFGKLLLTGMGSRGTFEGLVDRVGRWKVNLPPNTQPCSPCGPQSEYGPCDPDPKPPTPLQFTCGDKPLRGAQAMISYVKTKGIPSIADLQVGAVFRKDEVSFPKCPPDLPRGMSGPRLQAQWPEFEKIPAKDLARLPRLGVGDSVVVDIRRQRSYVNNAGTITKGDNCTHAPDLTAGYSECAITDYSVTFTRLR